MKVHVVGIGLIGGSMVLDIKSLHPEATIYGIDNNESHLAEAIALGVVDAGATFEDLIDADFVIVSVPVDVALSVLPKVLDAIGENTIVFEVGSTKTPICEAVANHKRIVSRQNQHHLRSGENNFQIAGKSIGIVQKYGYENPIHGSQIAR